ncbi:MAG: hypothetical protein QM765_30135 [Myxococcales bacterium]
MVERLRLLAMESRGPLAWFHWFERGDDLYADAAFILDLTEPQRLRPWLSLSVEHPERWQHLLQSRTGWWLFARETYLMGREGSMSFDLDSGGAPQPWDGSPFQEAMAHLGIEAKTQYFVPEDDRRFGWEPHRACPRSSG